MEILLYILSVAWFSNLISWRIDEEAFMKIKEKYFKHKIFNCSTCFGFWFSLVINFFLFNLITTIMLSFVISLVASVIEKYLNVWN